MNHKNKLPSDRELAHLLTRHTYREIAGIYNTCHSVIQRLRDQYGIIALSRKVRSKLLNRTDITKWSYMHDVDKIPPYFKQDVYPVTWGYYGSKSFPIKVVRALAITCLGRIIPKFIDCHHICENKACVNLRHIGLVPEQAHHGYHHNKVKEIPNSLILRLADFVDSDCDDCIVDAMPVVQQMGISDAVWDEFLTNSMLVKRLLKEAMQQASETEPHMEDLLSEELKQAA